MLEVPEGARCAQHVDSPARYVCNRCGDFLCGGCASFAQDAAFCRACAPPPLYRSTPGLRIAAHLIDTAAFAATLVVPVALSEADGFGVFLAFVAALTVGQGILIHRRGQSLGKLAMSIRTATLDGANASVGRVLLLRNLVPTLIGQVPLVGFIFGVVDVVYLFGDERRTLHDRIAGTVVVDTTERINRTFGGMPP